MPAAPEDHLFDRYRRDGDPDALSEVFDRVAEPLLRLARHVERDEDLAQELLGATLLTAVERAHRYDAARPLLPWLSGILVRESKRAHRRRARRPDPARLPERRVREPWEGPHASEVREEVSSALDRLGPADREILRLRLHEELAPRDLAARLGLTPGAVRVRLHRALARLRRSLPPGFALPAVAVLPGGDGATAEGVAAVRAAVLSQAGAAPSKSAVLFGALLVRKTTVAAACLFAVVLGSGLYVLSLARPEPEAGVLSLTDTPSAADPDPDGASAARASTGDSGKRVARASVPEPPEDAPLPAPSGEPTDAEVEEWIDLHPSDVLAGLVVRGRRPVSEGWAFLRPRSAGALPDDLWEPGEGLVAAPLEPDGTFRFAGLAAGEVEIAVRLEDGTERRARRKLSGSGRTRRVVFVLFEAAVHGTVRDEEGRVLPQAVVRLTPKEPEAVGTSFVSATRTDARGGYRFDGLMSGPYDLHLLPGGDLRAVTENVSLRVHLDVGEERRVDFGRPGGWPRVRGTLERADGARLTGGRRLVGRRTSDRLRTSIDVAADGTFERPLAPGEWRFTAPLFDGWTGLDPVTVPEAGGDLVLVVPGVSVSGRVRYVGEWPDAELVLRSVQLALHDEGAPRRRSTVHVARDGTFQVHGLTPGTYAFTSHPGRLVDAQPVKVAGRRGTLEVELRLTDP